jgi:hypothetical protein
LGTTTTSHIPQGRGQHTHGLGHVPRRHVSCPQHVKQVGQWGTQKWRVHWDTTERCSRGYGSSPTTQETCNPTHTGGCIGLSLVCGNGDQPMPHDSQPTLLHIELLRQERRTAGNHPCKAYVNRWCQSIESIKSLVSGDVKVVKRHDGGWTRPGNCSQRTQSQSVPS